MTRHRLRMPCGERESCSSQTASGRVLRLGRVGNQSSGPVLEWAASLCVPQLRCWDLDTLNPVNRFQS